MDSMRLCGVLRLVVVGFLVLPAVVLGGSGPRRCEFPAIFNFGDSNSDTGGRSAALSEVHQPNGETFFGHPSGRVCDGRLILDLIAEELKSPYLSAYLDSIGTDFRHGANFATGGSSIHPGKIPPVKSSLPMPKDFSKALYIFDIGQNDLAYGFQYTTLEEVRLSIPDILSELSQAVHQLYKEGARIFWVHNTGPIGCLPKSVINDRSKPGNLDQNGCVKPQNEIAQEFNRQLKDMVFKLRAQLPDAALTHVDMYSAKYALISNAKNEGFVDPFEFCCGSYYGYYIDCGKEEIVNGTVYGSLCQNPSRHVSWDGIHYSESANLWIANRILNGSFSDPPVSIREACYHPKNLSSFTSRQLQSIYNHQVYKGLKAVHETCLGISSTAWRNLEWQELYYSSWVLKVEIGTNFPNKELP